MRNGIYRVWFNGNALHGATATILYDGEIIMCGRSHTFRGRYTNLNGRFTAEVLCRTYPGARAVHGIPDVHYLALEGNSTDEVAVIQGVIREAPEITFDAELIWLCELQ